MAKKLIPIIVILVVLGAMVGVLFWLGDEDEAAEAVEPEEVIEVLFVPEGVNATRLAVENEHGGFTVLIDPAQDENGQSEYTLEGFEDYELARYSITPMVNAVQSLSALSLVAEGEGVDYGVYGLASPAASASITYSDGSGESLLIGDVSLGGDGYYVKTAGDPNVYLVSAYTVSYFSSAALELLDKTVTESITDYFQTARLSGSVREEDIEIGPLPEDEVDPESMIVDTHRLLSPVSASMDSQNGFETIQAAFGLAATEVAAVNDGAEALARYGLSEPYSVLTVTSEELGILTLSASEPDEDGMVYLTRSGVDLIYQVDAAYLPWLEVTYFDLMQKMAVLPFIDDVGTILVTTAAGENRIELTGEGQELEVTVNGTSVETSNFRSFYQNMVYASYDALPEEPMPEGSALLLSFTYLYRDGSESDVLAFYEGPARKVYMVHNGGRELLGPSTYVDKILEDIVALEAGEEIRTYI